ncbi:hypothetical protein FGG08_006489 [Glutinoglossum americanum]|uniref:Ankyrin repeat protein n=1 Tax=Glutinoglossum americanum TaxID=1670608 RepID=A0A9P8I7A0_9PEZI|nr:hypothetical protein FGG08_006489 [Glutinoglossum americanum]
MADPSQVIDAAVGCVAVCCRVYSALDRFASDAENADTTAADLRSRVGQLRDMASSVKLSLDSRLRQGRPLQGEEPRHLALMKASVDRAHQTLKRFEGELGGGHGDVRFRVLRQTLLAIRLQRIDMVVERFNQNLQMHIRTITIHFLCLQTYAHSVVGHLLEAIIRGGDESYLRAWQGHSPRGYHSEGRQLLPALENGLANEDNDIFWNLRETITVARSVVNSVWSPPAAHGDQPRDTPPGRSNSHASSAEAAHAPGRESEDSPDPDPKVITPLEILSPMIDILSKRVSLAQSCQDYGKAEKYQIEKIECLEERRTAYNFWFDRGEAQKTLANIYIQQQNRAEAGKIYRNLSESDGARDLEIEDTPTPLEELIEPARELRKRSRHYYSLAKFQLERYLDSSTSGFLECSAEYAKRAVTLLRRTLRDPTKPGSDFTNTVQLLVQTLEIQGKEVAAETYRQVYLNEPELVPPTPIQGRAAPPFPGISVPGIMDQVDDMGITPLVAAIRDGSCWEINYLLWQGADAGKLCLEKTPLMHAVERGDPVIVQILKYWREDLDLEYRDSEGKTALAMAACKGGEGMIEGLINAGAEVETAAFGEVTPLMQAASNGHAEAADALIRSRADCHAKSHDGWSVLHHAVYGPGGSTLVRRLIECGVNVNTPCLTYGQTPLHMAIDKFGPTPFPNRVELRGEDAARRDVLRVLLDAADVTAADRSGNTPLSLAVGHDNEGLARVLIDKGATYNGRVPSNVSDGMLRILNKRQAGAPLRRASTGRFFPFLPRG